MTQPAVEQPTVPATPPAPPTPPPAAVTIPVPPPPPAAPAQTTTVPPEEIARIRAEVEAAAAARIEEERAARQRLEDQVTTLSSEREARLAEEQQRQQAEAAAAEARRREELSFREALEESEQRSAQRMADLQQQIAQRDALLQKEREYADLMQYRSERLQAESDNIMPTLVDFVMGNTREEIDRSIETVKAKTAETLAQVQAAAGAARIAQPGASVTGAPAMGGPVDQLAGTRSYTQEELAQMPMSEYQQVRRQLLGAASQEYRGRGMFD